MRKMIEHLRTRPESHRHAIAFGVSLFVTLIIAGVWATTIFPSALSQQKVAAEKSAALKPQSPVTTFTRNAAQSFSAFKGQMSEIMDYFKETTYESQPTLQVIDTSGN